MFHCRKLLLLWQPSCFARPNVEGSEPDRRTVHVILLPLLMAQCHSLLFWGISHWQIIWCSSGCHHLQWICPGGTGLCSNKLLYIWCFCLCIISIYLYPMWLTLQLMGVYIYYTAGIYKKIIVILSICAKTSKRSRDNQNLPLVTKTLEIKQGFPSDLGIH